MQRPIDDVGVCGCGAEQRDGQTPFPTTAVLDEASAPGGSGTADGNVDGQVLTSLSRLLVRFWRGNEDGRERWGAGAGAGARVREDCRACQIERCCREAQMMGDRVRETAQQIEEVEERRQESAQESMTANDAELFKRGRNVQHPRV